MEKQKYYITTAIAYTSGSPTIDTTTRNSPDSEINTGVSAYSVSHIKRPIKTSTHSSSAHAAKIISRDGFRFIGQYLALCLVYA